MATTFDDDERSASQNRPIDLYTISTPTETYRVTSHIVDVAFAGQTYTALTMSRSSVKLGEGVSSGELIVHLPIAHPIIQSFAALGLPPREVSVTLVRLQEVSGQAQQQCTGFAQSMSISGNMGLLRVPSLTEDATRVRLPTVVAQRLCQHALFDRLCSPAHGDGPQRASFRVLTQIASGQAGTTIVVATMNGQPDNWSRFGELVHSGTGERRKIYTQVGTTLTINLPFVGAQSGDGVEVYAGCANDIGTCATKFSNTANYGGHPHMKTTINPWAQKGIGVIEQT